MKKTSVSNFLWVGIAVVAIGAALVAGSLHPPPSIAAAPPNTIVVYKSPTCNCCSKWIEHLKHAGFKVEAHNESDLNQIRQQLGVPEKLASCHTAIINGYVIEGHVPAEDIRQLLTKRPKARGLAVPGMPIGSPGMEVGASVGSYDVLQIVDGQSPSVFAHHGHIAH